jgi:hypothetical protein
MGYSAMILMTGRLKRNLAALRHLQQFFNPGLNASVSTRLLRTFSCGDGSNHPLRKGL